MEMDRTEDLTRLPCQGERSFLEFPIETRLETLDAHFAVLGIPFGMPYPEHDWPNEQSKAPDALRKVSNAEDIRYTRAHHDFDLGGALLDGKDIRIVDCGNVTAVPGAPEIHYQRAEQAARLILAAGSVLIALGGDHGVTIPIVRALEVLDKPVTLVHVDAHLDWRDSIGGESEGYSSPIRRASELPWIRDIIQIGMRGIGSARDSEIRDAAQWGSRVIDAYALHEQGVQAALEQIPDGGPYYLSIDADGVDPSLMPAVLAPTPGGLDWLQLRGLVHGLWAKGRVIGMDLVEIAPAHDVRDMTLLNAERLLCNFIGAGVRSVFMGS